MGRVIWHSYERMGVPVGEELFREAYVYAERELGRNPIIQPDYTFEKTLSVKLRIEMEHIGRCLRLDAKSGTARCSPTSMARQKPRPRSRDVLARLAGRMPLVLVSNFYGNIHTVLGEFGLDGLFAGVVESAVVGVRKPDPQIFSLGVKALGMEPGEVTVVGDSYAKDIVPAKAAGCHTVWMRGEGWTDDEAADTSADDFTIHRLAELL